MGGGYVQVTGVVDEDLGRRLLAGPLRSIPDSRPPNRPDQRFSPADALSTYFHGTPRQFSGSLFDSFGGGGDRPEVEDRITSEDLLAVAAVNAAMPAAVTNQLLSEPLSSRLTAHLRQLATDIDLWDAGDEVLAVASEAFEQIRSIQPVVSGYGGGWAAAYKLLARKRPRLMPLYDAKVRRVANLADGASWWLSLRHAMHVDGEDNEVRYRVCAAMRDADTGYVSVLRGLDVILWSYANSCHSTVRGPSIVR